MSPMLLNTVSPKTLLYSASEQNLPMGERTFLSYVWMVKLLQKVYFWKLEWKLFLLYHKTFFQLGRRAFKYFVIFTRWGKGVSKL